MSSVTSHIIDYKPEQFWKEQDFQTSARLVLQNWIWGHQLGYYLNPKIDIPIDQPIRIADVGCSNGTWILDLKRQRPHASFDGFDITASNFPAWQKLPGIEFHVWNAFSEVQEQFVGVFDVVHVRTLISAVVDNNVEPLLHNVLKMLKPGGYLQWDESDPAKLSVDLLENAQTDGQACKTFATFLRLMSIQTMVSSEWLYQLPTTLRNNGCEIIDEQHVAPRKELQRAWCDNLLTVWMGLISQVPETPIPMPKMEGLPEKMSKQTFADLFRRAVVECSKGAWMKMDAIVIVARKPE